MSEKIYESYSSEETFAIGKEIGENAQGGDIYCLSGDLGVGNSDFSKGLAKGLDINEEVNSPTFTIIQEYDDGRLPFYHFDVYRLADSYEMDELGYEEYFYGEGVTLIEWAGIVEDIIPNNAIWITIEKDLDKGLDYRKITIKYKD